MRPNTSIVDRNSKEKKKKMFGFSSLRFGFAENQQSNHFFLSLLNVPCMLPAYHILAPNIVYNMRTSLAEVEIWTLTPLYP